MLLLASSELLVSLLVGRMWVACSGPPGPEEWDRVSCRTSSLPLPAQAGISPGRRTCGDGRDHDAQKPTHSVFQFFNL